MHGRSLPHIPRTHDSLFPFSPSLSIRFQRPPPSLIRPFPPPPPLLTPMRASLLLSVGTTLLLSSSFVAQSNAQQLCNGYAELCSKTYDKVVFPMTHNAFAYNPPGGLATNQANDIPTQLKDGIRSLMLDAYASPSGNANEIELCHTDCAILDGGPLSTVLGQIKTFLDANPNEVVTIIYENAGNIKPAQFKSVYAAAGVEKYSYAQPSGAKAWPAISQMISTGKRLVSFVASGADASVPWLMAEFTYMFETPYSIQKDTPYPCTIDRPKDQRRPMYVLNHFIYSPLDIGGHRVDLPQPGAANKTNGVDLTKHASDCQTTFKQVPSFVAVDFYEKGTLFQTVAQLNGVTWNGQAATTPKGSGSGSGSRTTGGIGIDFGFGNGAADGLKGRMSKSSLGALAVVTIIGVLAF